MRWMFLWLILCLGIWAHAEDDVVPASIREHQWAYKSHGVIRYRLRDGGMLPDHIWADVSRTIIRPSTDLASRKAMSEAGTWGDFLRKQVKSIDDIIILSDDRLQGSTDVFGRGGCTELEPIATSEQLEWLRTLPDQWLAPIPDGYERRSNDLTYLSPWKILDYGMSSSARFVISRRIMPKREVDVVGGAGCAIYWCEMPLTDEQVLIEVLGISRMKGVAWDIELDQVDGQVITKCVVPGYKRTLVVWPSGNRLVYLDLPNRLFDTLVKQYLALHPSRWKERFKFDLKDIVLRTMDESLKAMRDNVDGPLEYLRYSFRIYPFDAALTRVSQVVAGNDYLPNQKKAIDAIHEEWFKTPVDRIQVADYRAAMVAYRNKLIGEIVAERDRIAKEGLKLPKEKDK